MFGDPEHSIKPVGYTEYPMIFSAICITGIENGRCKVNWFAWIDIGSPAQSNCTTQTSGYPGAQSSIFKNEKQILIGSTYSPTAIHPKLTIEQGETKIILELSVYKGVCKKDYDRDFFKLFFAHISPVFGKQYPVLMYHSIIFTPKPGTFDPNKPPQ